MPVGFTSGPLLRGRRRRKAASQRRIPVALPAWARLAPRLLNQLGMSPFHRKIVELLEGRYGVSPAFAEQFVPVFEQVAQNRPTSEDWESLMECLAAAYRTLPQVEDKTLAEAQVLVGQFVGELKKIDESLKVVGVFLERLRSQLGAPDEERTVH